MALTKIEIVKMLYEHIGIPKVECAQLVESVFDIIKNELGRAIPSKSPDSANGRSNQRKNVKAETL